MLSNAKLLRSNMFSFGKVEDKLDQIESKISFFLEDKLKYEAANNVILGKIENKLDRLSKDISTVDSEIKIIDGIVRTGNGKDPLTAQVAELQRWKRDQEQSQKEKDTEFRTLRSQILAGVLIATIVSFGSLLYSVFFDSSSSSPSNRQNQSSTLLDQVL